MQLHAQNIKVSVEKTFVNKRGMPLDVGSLLKRADLLHTRVVEDARVRTSRGGFLFILACTFSTILAMNSLFRYFSKPAIEYVERIEVDTQLSRRMPVELNISFPRLSCLDVELVVLDVSGEAQLDLSAELAKTRLTPDGVPLGDVLKGHPNRNREVLLEKHEEHKAKIEDCGSCYGAELSPDDCCNTCHEVKERYSTRGWDVLKISRESVQCLRELDHPEIAIQPFEGCQLHGTLMVNKVAGNIHVALGTTRKISGQVVHTYVQDQMGAFDTSHKISHMRFGELEIGTVELGQLDGIERLVDRDLGRTAAIQYFIHLVPVKLDDKVSFRFTKKSKYIPVLEPAHNASMALSTENRKHSSPQGPNNMGQMFTLPGVYFMYDFSPFIIVRERYQVPFIDLIADLLTVAGGVFALVRLLDSALFFTGN